MLYNKSVLIISGKDGGRLEQNYYTLLKLDVDTFISDPAVLDRKLEAVRQEWNKSNNTDIRSYVSTYYTSGVVKEAYSDPARWRRIYDQAKAQTDDAIVNYLLLSSGKGFLYEKELESCSNNKDIPASVAYVRKIAQTQGIEVRPDKSDETKPDAKKPNVKLSDFEPVSKLAFNASIKSCGNLLCTDFYDFLRKYSKISGITTQTFFCAETPPDKCARAAEEIIAAWSRKKETPERTAVENVCTVIRRFGVEGDKHSQENYNKQLKYISIKEILDKVWAPMSKLAEQDRILSGEAQMKLISELEKIVGDRAKAESVLEDYCRSKKISIAITEKSDRAYCPFCFSLFRKEGGRLPDNCPLCSHSFVMKCPKCGKSVNYAERRQCGCGFDLGIYPRVSKMCSDAKGFIDTLNFDYAEMLLSDADKLWKGFPELKEAQELLAQKKSLAGKMVSTLEEHISAREFFAAKAEYERICKAVPGYSDSAVEMKFGTALDEADRLFKQSKTERDHGARLRLLIGIKQVVSDYPGVDNELSSIAPMDVKSFSVKADLNSGCVNLLWDSDDPEGTVEYEVRRKAFSMPVSSSDGELVVRTTEKGCSDTAVREGMAYYYLVTAVRGRTKSKSVVAKEPAVIFPSLIGTPEIVCDESMISVSWKAETGKMIPEVFRSENPLIKKYGDGIRIRDCGKSGFADTGLKLGQKYFYNLFFRINLSGRDYISQPISMSGETARRGKPVTVSVKPKEGVQGRYEITIEDGIEFAPQVQFYASDSGGLASGTSAQVGQLTGGFGMKRIGVVPLGTGCFEFSLREGESCYVYPVTVSGSNAVLGAPVYAENFRQVGVRPLRTDGVNLYIELEEWIKGQEMMYVCWRFDGYPIEVNQKGNSKVMVNRLNYQSSGIVIPNIEQRDYYITGFIRSGGEERPVFRTEFKNRRKIGISYAFSYAGIISKQLKITLTMSEPSPLPEISVRTMMGAVPVFEDSGTELCVIPADSTEKREHVFALPGKINKNLHGKLFLRNAADKESFQLMLKSGETAKMTD